jgi:general secretion pathway protein J
VKSRDGNQTGFTLLEILIAMALSVVLLGVLTAGMRMVVDEWQDGNAPFEERLDKSLILLQVERALLGAMPHGYVDRDTLENNVYFAGGPQSISWVSTVSLQANQRMTAWQLLGDDRDGVVLKTTPAFADDPSERLENATGTLLLPGLELTVSYLTLDDVERVEWLDEWDGAENQALPMAVRLTFSDREQMVGDETEIVIPILNNQHETIQQVDTE